ncbi:MAG: flagellar hook-length control protein FliK [Tumebacillaceae bacterium]
MAVTTASTTVASSNNAAQSSATVSKTGTGKGKSQGSAFDSMLQVAGDTSPTATDDGAKQPDDLQTMLAALNGGLSPLLMGLPQQQLTVGDATAANNQTVSLTIGAQSLQLNLQNVKLNNGELATLLQKFGASPALMRVLLEQPQGELASSMAAHPELLGDLGKALSNVAQQVSDSGALLADAKVSALMQSILAQASQQQQSSTDGQGQNSGGQLPTMLGKLQATISTHAVEVGATDADKTADESTVAAPAANNSLVIGASVPFPLQPTNQPLHAEPNVVYMQADQMHNQLADLVVKRAALIEAPGRQEFRIVLQPQGLGEIEVRVEAVGNQISVHLTADNAASKGLLDSGLANLKNQLQSQGIQFNRIEVSTGSTGQGGEFSGLPQDRNSGQSFQGQQGNQSSNKRSNSSFAIDSLSDIMSEEDDQSLDGIDITA